MATSSITTTNWGSKETVKTACHVIGDVSTTASNIVSKEGARILLQKTGYSPLEPCADMAIDHITGKSNEAYKNSADKSADSLLGKISAFVSSFLIEIGKVIFLIIDVENF